MQVTIVRADNVVLIGGTGRYVDCSELPENFAAAPVAAEPKVEKPLVDNGMTHTAQPNGAHEPKKRGGWPEYA